MGRLILRSEWGARTPKGRIHRGLSGPTTGHWNGPTVVVRGQTTWDHSFCASLVRGIQNFHMDGRGWDDIAYNFLVCPHGDYFEGRGLNIMSAANGTTAANRTCHAICFLSGESNPFSDEEKRGFIDCVRFIDGRTQAGASVVGHRDHKSTACPGTVRYEWLKQGMPAPNSIPVTPVPQPTPSTPDKCSEQHPLLKKGATGRPVNHLQYLLQRTGAQITGDGIFGQQTTNAVINFQRWAKLEDDAIVGPKTWSTLHKHVDGLVI